MKRLTSEDRPRKCDLGGSGGKVRWTRPATQVVGGKHLAASRTGRENFAAAEILVKQSARRPASSQPSPSAVKVCVAADLPSIGVEIDTYVWGSGQML